MIVNGNALAGAAVQHPDGSHRRTYYAESPGGVIEDTGQGATQGGRGVVALDGDFAGIIRGDQYQVFVTPEGDCAGLFVTAKTPGGFEVRELKGGTSSLTFSYRIVAKRRDVSSVRLERVDVTRGRSVTRITERAAPAVPRMLRGVGSPVGDEPDQPTPPDEERRRRTSR